MFCLPPHTTHLLQPLDKTCFSPLKGYWNEECQKYMSSNSGRVVNRFNFSEIFAKAWKKAMVPSIISSGFQTTGVYPFSRKAVDIVSEESAENQAPYIPFCSPINMKHHDKATEVLMHNFTAEELKKFQCRFEEGYNIPGDCRYEQWKLLYHSESWSDDDDLQSDYSSSLMQTPPSVSAHYAYSYPGINDDFYQSNLYKLLSI